MHSLVASAKITSLDEIWQRQYPYFSLDWSIITRTLCKAIHYDVFVLCTHKQQNKFQVKLQIINQYVFLHNETGSVLSFHLRFSHTMNMNTHPVFNTDIVYISNSKLLTVTFTKLSTSGYQWWYLNFYWK